MLGTPAAIDSVLAQVSTCVDPHKAARWAEELQTFVVKGGMPDDVAAKFAGRLACSVNMANDKVGRAFVKPFYMQAYMPLPFMSIQLINASCWWVDYLQSRHCAIRSAHGFERPVCRLWSDAAGESRWLAAIACVPEGQSRTPIWMWTRMRVPQEIWSQLLERGDHQIGFQEFLAVILGIHTFELKSILLWSYIDNQSVLGAILRGSCKLHEINVAVGKFWMHCAAVSIGFAGCRVESRCNIADGPTRDSFCEVQRLGARFVEPRLPPWIFDLWYWPVDLTNSLR